MLAADQGLRPETGPRVTISVAVEVSSTPFGFRVSSLVTFVRRQTLPAESASKATEMVPEMDSFARSRKAASRVTGFRMISPAATSDSARDRRTTSESTSMSARYISPVGLVAVRVKAPGCRAIVSRWVAPSRSLVNLRSYSSMVSMTDCGSHSIRNAFQVKIHRPQTARDHPAVLSQPSTRVSSSARLSNFIGPLGGLKTRVGNCQLRALSSAVASFERSYSNSTPPSRAPITRSRMVS